MRIERMLGHDGHHLLVNLHKRAAMQRYFDLRKMGFKHQLGRL